MDHSFDPAGDNIAHQRSLSGPIIGQADQLSFDISQRIMNEMTYPGQVKITVIRERRAVSIAR